MNQSLTPRLSSSTPQLRAVWPPNVNKTPSGRSDLITCFILILFNFEINLLQSGLILLSLTFWIFCCNLKHLHIALCNILHYARYCTMQDKSGWCCEMIFSRPGSRCNSSGKILNCEIQIQLTNTEITKKSINITKYNEKYN